MYVTSLKSIYVQLKFDLGIQQQIKFVRI